MDEQYLHHPTFGLLHRLCALGEGRRLFATLYAQRMLFVVTEGEGGAPAFEVLNRQQARELIEDHLRNVRRHRCDGDPQMLERLRNFYIGV